jgi:hypothetical protein
MTTVTITDADIGSTIGALDGLLTSVRMAVPPSVYEVPDFDQGRQCFTSGVFVLRGSNDARDLVCVSPQTNGGLFANGGNLLANGSIGYRGGLTVVAVPRGSLWNVTTAGGATTAAAEPLAAKPPDDDHRQRHRRR